MKKHKMSKSHNHIKRIGKDGITSGPKPNYGKPEVIDSHRESTKKFSKEEY